MQLRFTLAAIVLLHLKQCRLILWIIKYYKIHSSVIIQHFTPSWNFFRLRSFLIPHQQIHFEFIFYSIRLAANFTTMLFRSTLVKLYIILLPLPIDDARLSRMCLLNSTSFLSALPPILSFHLELITHHKCIHSNSLYTHILLLNSKNREI